jgi:uncharacterized protein YutE (UPF0331/DUF86 family)
VTPGRMRAATLLAKAAQVNAMLDGIRALPLGSLQEFQSDPRNPASAESYLRRALEALLDLGRHMLAKAFAEGPSEYKAVANALVRTGLLDERQGLLMTELAGYRNRMVHFYDEVSDRELYEICTRQLGDVESLLEALLEWARRHIEKVDGTL